MPIPDKIATAKKISELLNAILTAGDFRLRYKITVDPQVGTDREWERPEILVEISGADSPLVLENGGELLRAFEQIASEMLRLAPNEHEKISFDCQNFRSARLQELRLATDVAAELILLQRTYTADREVVRRIKCVVSKEFEDIAVDGIRSRFQGHIYHSAERIAIDGAHVASHEIEFLDGIGIGEWQIGVDVGIVKISSVELIAHTIGASTIDLGILLAGEDSSFAVRGAIVGRDIVRSGNKEHQRLRVAARQWQINDLFLTYDLTKSRRIGRYHGSIRIDRDLLCYRTHFHLNRQAHRLVNLKGYTLLDIGVEACHRDRNLVAAHWQYRE